MQNTFVINCNWSRAILNGAGWENAVQLLNRLELVPEDAFSENGLLVKAYFISSLRKLIISIELDGDAVKETKQMTSPGSIFESLNSDYLFIRSRYLQKRKKLKEQLVVVNRMTAAL